MTCAPTGSVRQDRLSRNMARELAAAQARAQTATEAVEASRRETAAAAKEASELRTKLPAAEATAATLQAAHDALVARMPQPAARVRKAPPRDAGTEDWRRDETPA